LSGNLQIAQTNTQSKFTKEKSEDTTKAENEIDQLGYQLYGLTAEEIAIIENSVK